MSKLVARDNEIVEIADEEFQPIKDVQDAWAANVATRNMDILREERNRKLAETDWVVTMHKELGTNIPTAMKTYRQALRDITDGATSLDDVTWPTKPS